MEDSLVRWRGTTFPSEFENNNFFCHMWFDPLKFHIMMHAIEFARQYSHHFTGSLADVSSSTQERKHKDLKNIDEPTIIRIFARS
jgi:hypothetical protein